MAEGHSPDGILPSSSSTSLPSCSALSPAVSSAFFPLAILPQSVLFTGALILYPSLASTTWSLFISTDKLLQTSVYTDPLHLPMLLIEASTHCHVSSTPLLLYTALAKGVHGPPPWLFSMHFSALILLYTTLWCSVLLTPVCSQKLPLPLVFRTISLLFSGPSSWNAFSLTTLLYSVPGNRLGGRELPAEGLLGRTLGKYTCKEERRQAWVEGKADPQGGCSQA